MPKQLDLPVKESLKELREIQLQQKNNSLINRIQMLILIKQGTCRYQTELREALPYGLRSIVDWIKLYREGGLDNLLNYNRGGNRSAAIQGDIYQDVKALLNDPNNGITSYIELQEYLAEKGVVIKYKALYKFVKHHFNPKLKVGRKSNVKKDETAVAVFKNAKEQNKTY